MAQIRAKNKASHIKSFITVELLTLSSIYTHFNTLKKKKILENIAEKGEIAQNEQFHFFHNVFHAICILKSFNPFPNDKF